MRMRPEMSEEEERAWIEGLRSMPSWKKFERVAELTAAYRSKITAGLRNRYPQASEKELKIRMGTLLHGRELMMEVFGWTPPENEDDTDLL